ncbi:calcium-binding protein [Nocardioides antri]|uniref:Calcium-binding protein n=1 Tax=Nocardioides antri TaxID=2607659 RepID=A0A5B1LXE6_9ACTN|nr:calcium-binding protein [Nocardioides antri]KAA1424110.1 calcium-binding protein [Nocardioides antri]
MMSVRAALAMTASGLVLSLPALPTIGNAATEPAMCGGRIVTIDLNDPDAPDPNRDDSDVVLGTPAGELIWTGNGVDTVCGGAGEDVIVTRGDVPAGAREEVYGGLGGDHLHSSPGDELLVGGPGFDTVSYHFKCRNCGDEYPYSRNGVKVDLRLTGPQDTSGRGFDELSSIENLVGTVWADVLRGNGEGNRIIGFLGDDIVDGRRGADDLRGGRGSDQCIGGPGRDTYYLCERR